MEPLQQKIVQLVNSSYFRYTILSVILISAIIVGIETYPSLHTRYADAFHILDQIIIYIFLVEIILKILSKGKRPWDFFLDPWNVFDFLIVAVCFIPGVDTHYVMVLRLARILRVFRIISIFPKLQLLVNTLLKSIPSMGYVMLLLFMIFYIYGVLGCFLFAGTDPVHFGTLHSSLVTLFKVITLEGWTDIMNIQLYGTNDPSAEYLMEPVSYASVAYFLSFILIGAMIIMNLFIGVIMNSMQESHNELQKSMFRNQTKDNQTQTMLSELEEKVDELKTDIQKIGELLKKK